MTAIPHGLFITGTDTGIGKTRIAAQLVAGLCQQGLRAVGMKPVASGCERDKAGCWHNDDALALQQAAARDWPYEWINPYALPEPIAPHIAAAAHAVRIDLDVIAHCYKRLAAASDVVVVEGVGGWRVPLADDLSTADLVRALDLQVLMVVGMRLGCINHALLTAEALRSDGVNVIGWVANAVDPDYSTMDATLATLNNRLGMPLLGQAGYNEVYIPALVARIREDLALS